MTNRAIHKKSFRTIVQNLVLACFAIALALIICEIGLRLYYRNKSVLISPYRQQSLNEVYCSRYISHPFLPYAPKPGNMQNYIHEDELHGTMDTVIYTTNKFGFRFPLRKYTKEKNEKVIVFLGGSTTWDGPNDKSTWPALLTEKLNRYYQNKNTTISQVNLSVDGGNSAQSLINLMMWGVLFKPDLIISYDGINDFFDIGAYKKTLPDYSDAMHKFDDHVQPFIRHFPAFAKKSILVHLLCNAIDHQLYGDMTIYDQVYKQQPISSDQWQITAYQSFLRNIKCMKAISQEYGSPFLAGIPHAYDPNPPYYQFFDSLKVGLDNDSIRYISLLDSLPIHDKKYHYDPVHFTPTGLNAVADIYFKHIVHKNLLDLE